MSWLALMRREYLEHRAPFAFVPAGILVLLVLAGAASFANNRSRLDTVLVLPTTLKLFEFGLLLLGAMWFVYLVVTLFFYFGDAFNADRRNNAMLFWKSMPVSDLKILGSKLASGALLFPAIIFVMFLVSGLFIWLLLMVGVVVLPGLVVPAPLLVLTSFWNVALFALVYLALAVLWYAPFMMWVGGLSAVFGRWSLALAFVIPGLAAIVENVIFFRQGPDGGHIWSFLWRRWQFGLFQQDYVQVLFDDRPFDGPAFIRILVGRIDWLSLGAGLVVALVLLLLAAEYRRSRLG